MRHQKNPVESRRGCIPPAESRGGRIPHKQSRYVPSWLHLARGVPRWAGSRTKNPFESHRGYIPSRGIPRWPHPVQEKKSVPWLPDPVQKVPLKSRGNLIPRDLVPRSKTGPGEGPFFCQEKKKWVRFLVIRKWNRPDVYILWARQQILMWASLNSPYCEACLYRTYGLGCRIKYGNWRN